VNSVLVLRQLLLDDEAGVLTPGAAWRIFYGTLPAPGPQVHTNAILITQQPATQELPTQRQVPGQGRMSDVYGFQIRIRAESEAAAHTKASTICDIFDSVAGRAITIEDTDYKLWSVLRSGPPMVMGTDPADPLAFHVSVNVKAARITTPS
jgi:hypothetical protein